MMRTAHSRILLICSVVLLTVPHYTEAKKPDNTGGSGGDSSAAYTLVDLLGLPGRVGGGFQSGAEAVSNPDASGSVLVVGRSDSAAGDQPTLWTVEADNSFTIEDLGIEGSPSGANASAVNDWGVITINQSPEAAPLGSWVLVPGQSPQSLGASSAVFALNNLGQMTGWDTDHGAIWTLDQNNVPGTPVSLGDFKPWGISDAGIMAGEVPNSDGVYGIAAIARFDQGALQVQTLGVPPGFDISEATAISSNGEWVCGTVSAVEVIDGWAYYQDEAFVWSLSTGVTLLGTLGGEDSVALDVNDDGKVVGWSTNRGGKYVRSAFLWENNRMTDLNRLAGTDSSVHLDLATGVSESGHIAGTAKFTKPTNELKAVLLVPSGQ